jgi:hypothetical protein
MEVWKVMKKFFSMLFALAVACSFSLPMFARGTMGSTDAATIGQITTGRKKRHHHKSKKKGKKGTPVGSTGGQPPQ